jgi:uncharacterized protein (TIGR03084 family)
MPPDDTPLASLAALTAQVVELGDLLAGFEASAWRQPTCCEGWDVADVVLHLAQSNEMATASAQDRYAEFMTAVGRHLPPAQDVDEGAARWVERERAMPLDEIEARWRRSASDMQDALAARAPSDRVQWVVGQLSARTLTTTRLAETWIHTGDVAGAVGVDLAPTDRLWHIARLAWRTLPYAFERSGRTLRGPVMFALTGPSGDAWDFVPEVPARTTISGPAAELCGVAARRVDPADTVLRGDGPDAAAVLELVRTYA